MNVRELLVLAAGLSMDAFAVAVCKGLAAGGVRLRHCLSAGLYFGSFQALMPCIGYRLGTNFRALMERADHWIAFVLLGLIGFNMVRESRGETERMDASFSFGAMLPLAVATSIDALAVGVSFAFLGVDILPAAACIGGVSFAFSWAGVVLGGKFGARYRAKAELAGGIILMAAGTRILLAHLCGTG